MFLGQALIYIQNNSFIIKCEDTSILGINLGREELFTNRFDSRLKGEVLNTEVFKISAKDNKVILHV